MRQQYTNVRKLIRRYAMLKKYLNLASLYQIIKKLANLKNKEFISVEDFENKKAELLARL